MTYLADYGTYNGAPSKIHRAYENFDNDASTETSNYGATTTFTIRVSGVSTYSRSLQLYIKGNNFSVRVF